MKYLFVICLGHFGVIKLPATIYHPYLVNEVVHILNQICPGCKSIKKQTRKDMQIKVSPVVLCDILPILCDKCIHYCSYPLL